ncbi:MAG: hypothetical protein HYV08_01370 [Deltaproteobacteria bacterium]|nr:hypothetical protein [Deltaproteobacteria bacterium]
MMGLYLNLYGELSTRNPFFNAYRRGVEPEDLQRLTHEDGTLKEEWRGVFETFPDRFLFGIDVDSTQRLNDVERVVQYFRSVLAQLTPSTAEKIASGNLRRLLRLP